MKIYTDGYTIGKNPSQKGGGYVLTTELGERLHREHILQENFTNNEAELLGINKASQFASMGDEIVTDSQVAKDWAKNGFCKARPDLSPRAKEAKENIIFKKLTVTQVPREQNQAGIYIENNFKTEDGDLFGRRN